MACCEDAVHQVWPTLPPKGHLMRSDPAHMSGRERLRCKRRAPVSRLCLHVSSAPCPPWSLPGCESALFALRRAISTSTTCTLPRTDRSSAAHPSPCSPHPTRRPCDHNDRPRFYDHAHTAPVAAP